MGNFHPNEKDFWWCIEQCVSSSNWEPNLILDDGGDATHFMLKYHEAHGSELPHPPPGNVIGILFLAQMINHTLYSIHTKNKEICPT